MQSLCHCSEHATVSVQDLMICAKCEDFMIRHPALAASLIEQWRALGADNPPEPQPETEIE